MKGERAGQGTALGEYQDSHEPSSVVDDVLDNTTDVTVLLGKVESTETGGGLAVGSVRLEDPSGLPLVADDTLEKGEKKASSEPAQEHE
jgi:hypothetical protein